ncbi:hypothetical protein SUGI_0716940 [Cryptomeria japonica]|nr:hypothetical protein SUGI_0716940 [Cryptomeria japonica]
MSNTRTTPITSPSTIEVGLEGPRATGGELVWDVVEGGDDASGEGEGEDDRFLDSTNGYISNLTVQLADIAWAPCLDEQHCSNACLA